MREWGAKDGSESDRAKTQERGWGGWREGGERQRKGERQGEREGGERGRERD